ncbi:hypothetical protein Sango_2105600 [Sesamum angolense]|uniref:Uncharacterized protein n=1 Tax=Sesamum angolense TaxID=2727404 RepID=A0AAE2BM49_9LAMI|nr:hypothetical protein Sango_2105600 [Sesamum angolense]
MNTSTSGCSSGCESGWTMYLDQLSNSTDPYRRAFVQNYKEKGERVNREAEEAEDLSMVSDASSGPPPHLHEHYACENQYYAGYACSVPEKKTARSKTKEPRIKKQHNILINLYVTDEFQDNVAPPQNHNSVEHVPSFSQAMLGESVAKKQFGFFKSSKKGKSSGGLLGKKRQ